MSVVVVRVVMWGGGRGLGWRVGMHIESMGEGVGGDEARRKHAMAMLA